MGDWMNTLTDYEMEGVTTSGDSLRAVKVSGRWLVVAYAKDGKVSTATDLFQLLEWVERNKWHLT